MGPTTLVSTIAAAILVARCAAKINVPSLDVPACPKLGTIQYNESDPNKTAFPLTQVDLCYTETFIDLTFTACNETNFYYNRTQGTNDAIYEYEVMEAFIFHGTEDPETYLEFEVNPGNVTYQAFVYNPSKLRKPGAPFDHFFITDPLVDGLTAETKLDRKAHMWTSHVQIPLGLFNVNNGTAKGTKWRMNFFRTVTSPEMFPNQQLGAWSVTNMPSFHETPYFGDVTFV